MNINQLMKDNRNLRKELEREKRLRDVEQKEYAKLYKAYNKLHNVYSQQESKNQKVIEDMDKEYHELKRKYDDISNIPLNEMTYDRFINSLKIAYSPKDFPKQSGIYLYVNKHNGNMYIGQSVNCYNRLQQHFRRGAKGVVGHDEQFTDINDWLFYMLEFCPKGQLNDSEHFWIALAKRATRNKFNLKDMRVVEVEANTENKTNGNLVK